MLLRVRQSQGVASYLLTLPSAPDVLPVLNEKSHLARVAS
jgi:hypothetical protein